MREIIWQRFNSVIALTQCANPGSQKITHDNVSFAGHNLVNLATGENGTTLCRTSAINWTTNVPTITWASRFRDARQNGQFVAVGVAASIFRSQLVPDTNASSILAYRQADDDSVFLLSGAVPQECTLDSASNSLQQQACRCTSAP